MQRPCCQYEGASQTAQSAGRRHSPLSILQYNLVCREFSQLYHFLSFDALDKRCLSPISKHHAGLSAEDRKAGAGPGSPHRRLAQARLPLQKKSLQEKVL